MSPYHECDEGDAKLTQSTGIRQIKMYTGVNIRETGSFSVFLICRKYVKMRLRASGTSKIFLRIIQRSPNWRGGEGRGNFGEGGMRRKGRRGMGGKERKGGREGERKGRGRAPQRTSPRAPRRLLSPALLIAGRHFSLLLLGLLVSL